MIIKHPNSDKALRDLWNILEFIGRRIRICERNRHDFITIIYISSYIISPNVFYRSYRLLDMLRNIANISPRKVICLVRTTTPYCFPKSLKKLQKQALDSLRDKCYVVVYTPNKEFLNHAKFIIYYHFCFSERILYSGKYYGSTNFTMAGLSGNILRAGNYEEYTLIAPKPRLNFSRGDRFYIDEVYNLVSHKVRLYTDVNYLRHYISEHIRQLDYVLRQINQVLSGTTLGELFEAYINAQIIYNQTFALLDQIPGKKLTQELIEYLEKEIGLPTDPFELEMIIPYDIGQAEIIAKDLGFDKDGLRKILKDLKLKLQNAYKLTKEKYLEGINTLMYNIMRYADDKELFFIEFLLNYHRDHLTNLKRLRRVRRRNI